MEGFHESRRQQVNLTKLRFLFISALNCLIDGEIMKYVLALAIK